jgi:hypothetical protein
MIDINNAVQLNVNKKTARVISTTLVLLTTLILIILLWVVITKDNVGEDWLLTLVALFPSILIITSGWFYIQLAKKSLNSNELLQQTFSILSLEIPQALERRLVYYTKMYDGSKQSDSFFKAIGQNKESLLDSNYMTELIDGYFSIQSNVVMGLTSCQYKISGDIIKDYPLIEKLTIGLQINISQVEATYTFDNLNGKQIKKLIEKTEHAFKGAESAGYTTRVSVLDNSVNSLLDNSVKFKARMDFKDKNENANLLLDSCEKQFFVQDFSLMSGSLISLLRDIKL